MSAFFRRLRRALGRARFDRDLRDEIEAHRALRQAQLERDGLPPSDAAAASRRALGNTVLAREEARAVWTPRAPAAIWRAIRPSPLLWRQRGHALMCVCTLAFAVGATLVVFTIVSALWLKPLPIADADRVVMIMGDSGSSGSAEHFFFADEGRRRLGTLPAFESVAGEVMTSGINDTLTPQIAIGGQNVETLGVTPEYFGVLGLHVRGRDFTPDDDRDGAPAVAIIGQSLWQRAFDGRADVIGAVVPASPFPIQIVGVAPDGFRGARLGERTDLWIPHHLIPRAASLPTDVAESIDGQGGPNTLAIARLRRGVTPLDAERMLAANPPVPGFRDLAVVPIRDVFGSPAHRTIIVREDTVVTVITSAAAVVLAGACVTLVALVLVHYERRRQEFAIRLALGASRRQLAWQLTGELAWLAGAGCLGAIVFAAWGARALPALSLPGGVDLSRLDLSIDWRAAAAAIGASLLTMACAAAMPMSRVIGDPRAAGLGAGAAATPAPQSLRLRKVLLAVHAGATALVLVTAGLFVHAVQYGFDAGPGFDLDHTLFIHVDIGTPFDGGALQDAAPRLPRSASQADRQHDLDRLTTTLQQRWRGASQRVLDRLARVPGVERIALGGAPIGPDAAEWMDAPQRIETARGTQNLRIGRAAVGVGYLEAIGLRLAAGQSFSASDARVPPTDAQRTIVTVSLASALWPGESPLGQHLRFGDQDYVVIGVVDDFAFGSLAFDPKFAALSPTDLDKNAQFTLNVVVRTPTLAATMKVAARAIDEAMPGHARVQIATGDDVVRQDLGRERLGAWFFSGFGLVALGLGIGGVFGLVAYLTESRRREFGVRIALGAAPRDVVGRAVWNGLVPVIIGVLCGLVAAAMTAQSIASLLIGISRLDVLSYAGAGTLMLVAATAAGLAAAWRLRRLSAVDALRAE